MPFPGTDFPTAHKEAVFDVNGKMTSYFFYLGNNSEGFYCKLFVNGTRVGEYDSKAHARTAGNNAGA